MMERRVWHDFYDPGVPISIDFQEKTLPQLLERSAALWGDRPAVRFLGRTMSYAELKRDVDRFATALRELGVEEGTRVAIQLPNLPQTVIAFYATLACGGVAVMTNPLYMPPEIEHQWNDAGCEVAVTTDFLFESRVRKIRGSLPVKHYVIASIPEYLRFPVRQLATFKLKREEPPLAADVSEEPTVHRFSRLVAASRPMEVYVGTKLEEPAALQYTGGTTGVSKGAVLTHANLSWNAQQNRHWLTSMRDGEETFLSVLPFFHVFGLTVAMNLPISIGAAMVLLPNPRDVARIISSINKFHVTIFPVVPAMVNAINASHLAKTLNVKSLKLCVSGSAPLRQDTLERFEALTGGTIVEGFGLTESSPVTHVNPSRRRKINSIGLPLPDTDCRIVGDDGRDVGAGEEGELVIRGPQVMRGYWNRPEETAGSIRGGWLFTGDLASMDEEGYFRICGRKKEMIVAGGYNIYPDEIDHVLSAHPCVLECATIGVPDERRGETVKSFVVLRPDTSATAEEIQAFCRERLAAYKIPRAIEFREELPKNSVLKILRRELLAEEMGRRTEVGS